MMENVKLRGKNRIEKLEKSLKPAWLYIYIYIYRILSFRK